MNVAVVGLWHLGCVTAACLAKAGHSILAYDPNQEIITQLQNNQPPIFEPGLEDLLAQGKTAQQLIFSNQREDVHKAEIVWITFDTPVDENDHADVDTVINEIVSLLPYLSPHTLLLISSQLPLGSTQKIKEYCANYFPEKNIGVAYSPENLRLGKAIEVFTQPDRVVIGVENEKDKERLQQLFAPFTTNLLWMSIESAEMTKHAINAFLATSVVFINELADLCEHTGANAREVELGLKSEARIGPKAYLRPGAAIAGGTLLRDINYLIAMGAKLHLETPFFSALLSANNSHKQWLSRKLLAIFQNLQGKKIATLGLTYKAGTDTLRRSTAIEVCEWLHQQGVHISAYDPVITQLPEHLAQFIGLKTSIEETVSGVDAVIITSEWPQFTELSKAILQKAMAVPRILDASGFLMKHLGNPEGLHYYTVGHESCN